jgi:primosomal protein N'
MRSEPDDLIELARRGLVDQFYDGEIQVRKSLGYPPYSTFILLSYMGKKEEVAQMEEGIKAILGTYEPQFYSAPYSNAEKTLRYGLLRIAPHAWPSPTLIAALRALPPYIKIEMNPEKIV